MILCHFPPWILFYSFIQSKIIALDYTIPMTNIGVQFLLNLEWFLNNHSFFINFTVLRNNNSLFINDIFTASQDNHHFQLLVVKLGKARQVSVHKNGNKVFNSSSAASTWNIYMVIIYIILQLDSHIVIKLIWQIWQKMSRIRNSNNFTVPLFGTRHSREWNSFTLRDNPSNFNNKLNKILLFNLMAADWPEMNGWM